MNRSSRKWLRRALFVSLIVIALLVLLALFVLGTERGTRFAFRQVANYSPLEIDADRLSGTLLSEIGIAQITYRDDKQTITIERVVLNIDWSASGFYSFFIDHLSVASVTLVTDDDEPPSKEPLEISMPAIPIELLLRNVRLDTLVMNQLGIDNIALQNLGIRGSRFDIAEASAYIDNLSIGLQATHVELNGEVPVGGDIAWNLVDSKFAGSGTVSGDLKQLEISHRLDGDYQVVTQGTVQLLNQLVPTFDLSNEFTELHHADWTASNGRVRISGTVDDYQLTFDSAVSAKDGIDATLRGSAGGDSEGFDELEAAATMNGAELRVQGSIAWAPELALDLTLVSRDFNPANFVEVPASSLDAQLRLQATGADEFTVDILSFGGVWNGQDTDMHGQLSRNGESWRCDACRASVGNNRVNVDGGIRSKTLDGNFDIDAPSLDQLWPGIVGSFNGNGNVSGTFALPMLSGLASGQGLGFGGWSLGFLSIESQKSTPQNLNVAVVFSEFALDGTEFGAGRVEVTGGPENVDVSADWRMDGYAASARVKAEIEADTINGSIEAANIRDPFSGTWTMESPTEVSYRPDHIRLGAAAWSNGDARFQHKEILQQQDELTLSAGLNNGPLTLMNTLLPENVRIDGSVDVTVDLLHDAGGWNGQIDWRQRNTVLQFIASDQEMYNSRVPLASMTVKLVDNAATVRGEVHSESGTEVTLDVNLDELGIDANLRARLQFGGEQWDWVPMLAPDIDNFAGTIRADIRASGKLQSPDLQGDLTWTEGEIAVPALNLPLSDIDVTLSGSSAGDMTVSGAATSGDGNLQVRGRLDDVTSLSPSFDIKLLGERATLLNWNDYLLVASPQLEFIGDTEGVNVTGRVAMDKAEIVLKELPEGAVTPSDDVSVVGRDPDVRQRTRVSGDVEIVLSDDVHINAFGLDTNLEGELRLVVPQNRAPQGTGELRLVGGVFEAYGQRLEIESGTLVFTGPLDDPLINVRAVRSVDSINGTVTVGIQLSGRTEDLSSTLFSDPSMSEAEALSYLVLGRPLSDASAADGSNLSNSAYSLGLRQAALVTNQIGQAVGLDELTVGGSNQNTTELIAGKQINSRLYARFAYGVFSRLGKLLMRYKLSDSFAIEIGAGEHQSMDILYTIEKE